MSGRDAEKHKPKMGGVDKVEQQLYSHNSKIKDYRRYGFSKEDEEVDVQTSWDKKREDKKVELLEKEKKPSKPMTTFTKLFLSSVLFFTFSALAAVLVFLLNTNQVNYDAVSLSVLGPNAVAGGAELNFDITVTNNNPVDIVLSDVIVNFPAGAVTADEEGLPLEKDIISIDEIRSGLSETVKFKAVLFGSEGETKDIHILYQYRVPGSDNIFFKERVYQVALESTPVVLSVQHDPRFQSGEEVVIGVDVTSNASKALRNLFLSVDYPFGFEFASSSPVGVDSTSFLIGELQPGERYHIDLFGTIRGQDGESRTIRYLLGSEDRVRPGNLGTVFAREDSSLLITKPPIILASAVNRTAGSIFVAQPGQEVDVVVSYENSLLTKLLDNVVSIGIAGTGYDRRDIDAQVGYYRSADETVSWNQNNVDELAELEPGQNGTLNFSLTTLASSKMAGLLQNPEIVLTIGAEATNFELGGEEKKVGHEIVQRIKVATDPTVDAYLLHGSGPFENSGPMQPEIGSITTYTLVVEARNTTNAMQQTVVSMNLPRYVELQERLLPQDALIDYDERSRTITWEVGELAPGVGYTQSPRQLFLSIAFEPSLDQIGAIPELVQDISLRGTDSFTEIIVSDTTSDLDTDLDRDPEFDFTISPRVKE